MNTYKALRYGKGFHSFTCTPYVVWSVSKSVKRLFTELPPTSKCLHKLKNLLQSLCKLFMTLTSCGRALDLQVGRCRSLCVFVSYCIVVVLL